MMGDIKALPRARVWRVAVVFILLLVPCFWLPAHRG